MKNKRMPTGAKHYAHSVILAGGLVFAVAVWNWTSPNLYGFVIYFALALIVSMLKFQASHKRGCALGCALGCAPLVHPPLGYRFSAALSGFASRPFRSAFRPGYNFVLAETIAAG